MNLEKFGVQELSVQEQKEVQGGWLWNFFRIGWPDSDGTSSYCYLFGFKLW